VGAAVGGLSGLLADSAADVVPPLAAGALGVALAIVLTGALHLDGLADTADALGGATRERALEIMRDHAVGVYGAAAIALVCILDASLLAWLAERDDAALAGVGAGAAARAVMLPTGVMLPYARESDGQGRLLEGVGAPAVVVAAGLAVLLSLPAGVAGLAGAGAAAAVAAALGALAWLWLRGATGDVLGATAKCAETTALLVAVAVLA
jgi:adenosylcobinamide-GDP ribazoletransferase